MRNTILVLLLALFLAPIINAQTSGQVTAEYQFALCGPQCEYGSVVPGRVPAFFVAASFGNVTGKDQSRTLSVLADTGRIFVRRQVGSGSYFYEPGAKVIDTDALPEGSEVVYTVLRVAPDGGMTAGFVRSFVGYIPAGSVVGYDFSRVQVSAHGCAPREVCNTSPSGFVLEAEGLLPDNAYVIGIGKDGSISLPTPATLIDSVLKADIQAFTERQTAVDLVVWYPDYRIFQTIQNAWRSPAMRYTGAPRDGRPN